VTALADPLQRHVADVGEESSVIANVGNEFASIVCVQGLNGSTSLADQMDVGLFFADGMESRCTVADVGMCDEPDLFEDIEHAIDSGQRHTGCNALDLVENFLRGPVAKAIDRFEHELTLWGDPIAVDFENFVPASGQISHVSPGPK
jgi:hypothetical protein